MPKPVWIGIDLGTQSVRVMAADEEGSVLAASSQPLNSSRRSGREHTQDPEEWWTAVCASCDEVMSSLPAGTNIEGLAIDATSGTIVLTDDRLRPASEALMYDDGRAEAEAREIQEAGEHLWADLGYRIQPSWAIAKLLWLCRHPGAASGRLRLTHQNDFIHQRMAGRSLPADSSHSLKSGYDLIGQRWPLEVFEKAGIPAELFPEVVSPESLIGAVSQTGAAQTGLPEGTHLIAGMTDGCAAQIAAGAVKTGSWNSVLGTTLVVFTIHWASFIRIALRKGNGCREARPAPGQASSPGTSSRMSCLSCKLPLRMPGPATLSSTH